MDKIHFDTLENMMKSVSSNQLAKRAFRLLLPKKNEFFRYLITILLSLGIAIVLAFIPKTVDYLKNAATVIQSAILAVYAIVFTGYALFQALLGRTMLKKLLKVQGGIETNKTSKLQELNESFIDSMMLDIVCIIINVVMLIVLPLIPEDWLLIPDNLFFDEIIVSVLIFLYLYLSFTTLFDVKSFVGNIAGCFNLYAISRVTEMLDKKEVELVENNPDNKNTR